MAWDIGAFEYVSAGGLTTNTPADTATVSDTPVGALALVATPSESSTVTDTPVGALALLAVPTAESSTVTDTAEGALGSWHVSVEEPVTATDTPTPVLDLAGSTDDTATVSDTVEDAALVDLGENLTQSVEEPATVADTVTDRYLGSWHGTATDPITVTDSGEGALGSWYGTATESVVVTDEGEGVLIDPSSNLTQSVEEPVSVADTPVGYTLRRPIFVTDTPTGALSLVVTVSEPVSVTDVPSLGSEIRGTAYETITVSETTGTELSTVVIVTDTATGLLSAIDLTPQVEDRVVVTDTPLPNLGANNLTVTPTAESVTVADNGTGRLGHWEATVEEPATVTDTVAEAELFVVESPLTRSLSESIAVTDSGRGFMVVTPFTSDHWKVPYERRSERVQHESRAWRVPHERRVWRITRNTP